MQPSFYHESAKIRKHEKENKISFLPDFACPVTPFLLFNRGVFVIHYPFWFSDSFSLASGKSHVDASVGQEVHPQLHWFFCVYFL